MTPQERMQEMSEGEKKRLFRLAKVADTGQVGVVDELNKLDDKIDENIGALRTDIDALGEQVDTNQKALEAQVSEALSLAEEVQKMEGPPGHTPVPGVDFPLPKDGVDYILTPEDREAIARAVPVPVVERVVERIEVTKEQPIITEVTNTVENPVTPEDIKERLESLEGEGRLDAKAIKNLPEATQQIVQKAGWGAHPLVLQADGITVDKNTRIINFSNATITRDPDGVVQIQLAGSVEDIDGLVDALEGKVDRVGDTMTGPLYINSTSVRALTAIGEVRIGYNQKFIFETA